MAGSGFNATPGTGELRKQSSWGRTRSPKGLIGGQRTSPIAIIAHGDVPSGITATDGTAGYVTENQRYLFVTVDNAAGNAPGRDIEVWVYLHATGIWSFFQMVDCSAITQNTTYKIEIAGADRVAFVRDADAWTATPTAVYAACSSF
jgi:hypothetical protein